MTPNNDPAAAWFYIADAGRTTIRSCTFCDALDTTPCDHRPDGQSWYHAGRCWQIGITQPGGQFGDQQTTLEPGRCRPTVEDAHDDNGMAYRGACLGCGWAGIPRRDENVAVEDAHDHAWPGWRELPLVGRCPHDATAAPWSG